MLCVDCPVPGRWLSASPSLLEPLLLTLSSLLPFSIVEAWEGALGKAAIRLGNGRRNIGCSVPGLGVVGAALGSACRASKRAVIGEDGKTGADGLDAQSTGSLHDWGVRQTNFIAQRAFGEIRFDNLPADDGILGVEGGSWVRGVNGLTPACVGERPHREVVWPRRPPKRVRLAGAVVSGGGRGR